MTVNGAALLGACVLLASALVAAIMLSCADVVARAIRDRRDGGKR